MLTKYIDYLQTIQGTEDFQEKALSMLLSMLPTDKRSVNFACDLIRLIQDEQIKLSNGVYVNLLSHKVYKDRKEITLTQTEEAIVELLAEAHGKCVEHGEIIETIWGYAEDNSILKVNISNIRNKIDVPIVSVKGKGYLIESAS